MNDIQPRTLKQLQLLADGLKENPDYMAWVFANFQKIEKLSDAKLMQALGTSQAGYARISLCKRPLADSQDFASQMKQIADYSNTDPSLLANIIRQVDAVQALRSKPDDLAEAEDKSVPEHLQGAVLAAARDRMDLDQGPESETDQQDDQEGTEGGNDLVDE
jgi:hypothetical protein